MKGEVVMLLFIEGDLNKVTSHNMGFRRASEIDKFDCPSTAMKVDANLVPKPTQRCRDSSKRRGRSKAEQRELVTFVMYIPSNAEPALLKAYSSDSSLLNSNVDTNSCSSRGLWNPQAVNATMVTSAPLSTGATSIHWSALLLR